MNSLIADRDRFLTGQPVKNIKLRRGRWGVLDTGGNGPCLLLLPGTMGSADIFWKQIEILRDRARVVSVTYPESSNMEDWVLDVVALLDKLGINKTSILGTSLGGYLAQFLVRTHEERCTTLFVANTMADNAPIKQHAPYSLDIDTMDIDILRKGIREKLDLWKTEHPMREEIIEFFMNEANNRLPPENLRARLKCLKEAPPLTNRPISVRRVIVIEAEDDPRIPEVMRKQVRETLKPDITFLFRTGGHFPFIAEPEKYASILEEGIGLNVTGPKWSNGKLRVL